ncbi:MAG: S41 family peptidase [Verrucomicrobiota bacterium]
MTKPSRILKQFILFSCTAGALQSQVAPVLETAPQEVIIEQVAKEAPYQGLNLFASVMEMVRENYVNPKKTGYEELTESAIEGMLYSLDPHCEFLDIERYSEVRSETQGTFGGVGIYVGVQEGDQLVITMPVSGGPAARAGLMPGDQILEVDGYGTKGMSLPSLVKLLRGQEGELLNMSIYRPASRETLNYTVQREFINVPSIRNVKIIDRASGKGPSLGYMWIVQFGEKTVEEFDEAIESLRAQGMDGLVLDLRNNPGGLLDSAVQLAGRFVSKGRILVSTEGRPGDSVIKYYRAEGERHYLGLPLVILVNRHSASSAEIVSGALRDLGRAVVIGERTYGKGSVQTIQAISLGANQYAGLRLTTAYYYTPSRQKIHGVGIRPHVTLPITFEEERGVYQMQNVHMLSPAEQEALIGTEDRQLQRAASLLEGILLYDRAKSRLLSRS